MTAADECMIPSGARCGLEQTVPVFQRTKGGIAGCVVRSHFGTAERWSFPAFDYGALAAPSGLSDEVGTLCPIAPRWRSRLYYLRQSAILCLSRADRGQRRSARRLRSVRPQRPRTAAAPHIPNHLRDSVIQYSSLVNRFARSNSTAQKALPRSPIYRRASSGMSASDLIWAASRSP